MRIGIITDPLDTKSSVRVYLTNLIERLSKLYDKDKIYLIHAKRGENSLYQQGKEIILPGFYRDNFPSASLADIFRPFLLRKYKLDIIHYPHSHSPLTFPITGSKNVCLITTVGPFSHPQFYPLLSRYLARISRFLNRQIDMLITESESEKREVVRFFKIPPERVRVIPSGVDDIYQPLNNLDQIKAELSSKYKIGFPYILHVGGYRPIKNGLNLIRAFATLKRRSIEHKLVFVGKPVQKFNEVRKLIKEFGLGGEVITTGFVPDEDLPKFYNGADLFVFPSFKESFGHALVEAMACGCPVVTSNVTCMPEVVGNAGVLIDPYSVESLTEGMYKVLIDGKLRENLSRKGLEQAKLFSWERCAKETLKVYEELYKERLEQK